MHCRLGEYTSFLAPNTLRSGGITLKRSASKNTRKKVVHYEGQLPSTNDGLGTTLSIGRSPEGFVRALLHDL